jgi:AcrR family transcriptional regulator
MSSTRGYRSSLREEQARRTRRLIRQAARELYGRRGFVATTVADIAERAGVSAATVYANYESKAGIVLAMLEDMLEAAGIPQGLGELFAEPDAGRQLRMWVDAHCALFEGGADILRAAMVAAQAPEVAALMERGDASRRQVIDQLVARWEREGALRAGLPAREAADRMYLLSTVVSYLTAVDRLGWSPERYGRWLTDLLAREILGTVHGAGGEAARIDRDYQG